MRKTVLFAAAGVGLMIALASHDAQAFAPMGAMPWRGGRRICRY
jgi:hypothetical protein